MSILELATRFGISLVEDLSPYPFVVNRIALIPYAFAKRRLALPVEQKEGRVIVAVCSPFELDVLEEVRTLCKQEVIEILVPRAKLEEAIERVYHQKDDVASALIRGLQEDTQKGTQETNIEGYDLLEQTQEAPAIRLLNAILTEAIQQGASDIHFEPGDEGLSIRYRIDGALAARHAPPKEMASLLITRLKVMAKLDIAEKRLPQDGRMILRLGGRQIDFRMSTVPVVLGERIVLRILDKGNIVLGLGRLGMRQELLQQFEAMVTVSEGIVLVTGPTGSGKTTTLYSALSSIQSSDVNIMTIEDPVEYKLAGLAQIAVNPKIHLDFARGLRHILRQDPDVVMIGEIRDRETAEIAIQASLTGHLVLSTLHTNDAPSALTRLVDMGLEPYLLSSSVVGVLAQRLVRLICPFCKISYAPTAHERSALQLKKDKICKAEGCKECFGTGYKGRYGIYELMPFSSPLKRQLLLSADASALKKIAIQQGMKTLREEGSYLVDEGLTSSAEVLRVTRGFEE